MTKVIMHGCNGMMGQMITRLCKLDEDIEIVAGIDLSSHLVNEYPVFSSFKHCDVAADVVIDFASAKAMDGLLAFCVEKQMPVVLCTTGINEEQQKAVAAAAKKVAVLKSANMSLGINMLYDLLRKAAQVLAPAGFDMEILEMHHNQKLDAPSGTALALADVLNDALDQSYSYCYDRSKELKKREKTEIGIQSVRGGSIVGDHQIIFAGPDEVITFQHTAYSKGVFGKGAIEAAKFMKGKPAGYYDMKDVIAAV